MTDKNREIEEMAKAVCVNCTSEVCASGRCAYQYDCPLSMETIKRLHLKGYRLASEVAAEIFAEIETSLVIGGFVNGEKYIAIREDDYNHYKKKYTGEGK